MAADKTIVQNGELPEGWGLMVPRGGGLGIAVRAQRREETMPPDLLLLASMLRNQRRCLKSEQDIQTQINAAWDSGWKDAHKDRDKRESQVRRELDELKKKVSEFEDISGLRINAWDMGREAELVELLRDIGSDGTWNVQSEIDLFLRHIRKLESLAVAALEQCDQLFPLKAKGTQGEG